MRNTSMRKMWVVMVAFIGMGALQATASADFINGAIGFGGTFNPTGGSGGLGDATGIDIDFSVVIAVNGDFAPALGAPAIFNQLDFNPANTPVTPLWSVTAGAQTFSFDLTAVVLNFQNANEINLSGTGTIMATGYDDTPGQWTFSGQQGNIFLTFSSISVANAVSEPATLVLLGVGLLGLGVARRRKS